MDLVFDACCGTIAHGGADWLFQQFCSSVGYQTDQNYGAESLLSLDETFSQETFEEGLRFDRPRKCFESCQESG